MKQEWKTPLRIGAVLFGLYLAVHYWGNLSALATLALGGLSPGAGGGHRLRCQHPHEHV